MYIKLEIYVFSRTWIAL